MKNPPWEQFGARWGLSGSADESAPVFLFAAGWRSGSTLVQRLICSSKEVLVWGEPYGRVGLVQSLTASAMGLNAQWPTPEHFGSEEVFSNLEEHWIANLYPPPEAMRAALAAPLETLFAWPAIERGFPRFGLKEVRLQAAHARFLNWIYPSARFVFLVRNPYDAWRSARDLGLMAHWSGPVMDTPAKFAGHWARLAASFQSWDNPNGLLLRYEELQGLDLADLAEHCQLSGVNPQVLKDVQTGVRRDRPAPLTEREIHEIRSVAGSVAESLGYTGPSVQRQVA